jgi:hypothetical protein
VFTAENDPALTIEDKLPIHGSTTKDVYNSTVAWAMTRTFGDDRTNLLYISGVATIIRCGMLHSRNNIPDGDWYEAPQAHLLTPEQTKLFTESINRETLTTGIVCSQTFLYC